MATTIESVAADQLMKRGFGKLHSLTITAASATPSLKVWDGVAASGKVILETFTPTVGMQLRFEGASFKDGLFIDITNTVVVTVEYE